MTDIDNAPNNETVQNDDTKASKETVKPDEAKKETPKETPAISSAEFEAIRRRNEELESKLHTIEENQKKEQGRWQELYEAEREKHTTTRTSLEALELKIINDRKISAFKSAVGGLARDSYAKHIDIDKIDMSPDGEIDAEKLKKYADEFRQAYPELLKPSGTNMPNRAHRTTGSVNLPLNCDNMSLEELTKQTSQSIGLFQKGRGV